MLKHSVFASIAIMCFGGFLTLYFPNFSYGKEYSEKPNVVHDFIGAKILTDKEIPFEKIVTTRSGSVIFCDADKTLLFYDGKKEEVSLKEKNSKRCVSQVLTKDGVKEDNGSSKLFGRLMSLGKSDKDNASDDITANTESKSSDEETNNTESESNED